MKISLSGERLVLSQGSACVNLELEDVRSLQVLNAYGRKIHFGRKAKLRLSVRPEDPEARLLMIWAALPVREWNFSVDAAGTPVTGKLPEPR